MIPKRSFGLCCCHIAQLMTHPAHLNSIVYLAVMLQASWHTAEGNKESRYVYQSIKDNLTTYLEYSNHARLSLCILTPCFEACMVLLSMKLEISQD